ncbi:MAG: ribose 1,5-bisphosphokinase [Gammaproteobacteria bacterium]|nr:ribose 1,5-bisphosphokinase [Gammaproteobacteria bacterium]
MFDDHEGGYEARTSELEGVKVGSLFYLMGASGVGKDALMAAARQRLQFDDSVLFAHRYITRPAAPEAENHIVLSEQEWRTRQRLGLFSLSWQSHGFRYGIGIEIDHWLQLGLNVVINGSREYLAEASRQYDLRPILVSASASTLRQRLLNRGREGGESIELRLQRAQQYDQLIHPKLMTLHNDAELETAVEQLLLLLTDSV